MSDWPPFAVQRYGPPGKIGGYVGLGLTAPKIGEIKHSAVGVLPNIFSMLDSTEQVSWQYTIAYDGTVYAHYPLSAICWHAGSARWNIDTVGIEHEGGPLSNVSEPLTPAQFNATVRLTEWIAEQFGRTGKYGRYPANAQWWLLEHNQVKATACPSGRIPWVEILEALSAPQTPPIPPLAPAQVAHAAHYLYAAFFEQNKSRLHPFDAGVIQRTLDWWKAV